jgi:hypothetical protein
VSDLIFCLGQAVQFLPQMFALSLDFLWLPQKVTTPFHGYGVAQAETLAESDCQALANATDELRIDDEWDIVHESVQRN